MTPNTPAVHIEPDVNNDIFAELKEVRKRHPNQFLCAYLNINSFGYKFCSVKELLTTNTVDHRGLLRFFYTPAFRGAGVYCFTSVRPSFRPSKIFWIHQIPTSCLSTLLIIIHIEHLNIYAHFSSHFSQQQLMAKIWYLATSFM